MFLEGEVESFDGSIEEKIIETVRYIDSPATVAQSQTNTQSVLSNHDSESELSLADFLEDLNGDELKVGLEQKSHVAPEQISLTDFILGLDESLKGIVEPSPNSPRDLEKPLKREKKLKHRKVLSLSPRPSSGKAASGASKPPHDQGEKKKRSRR